MNELIEYLLNYAFDHGIGYKLVHADPYDPSLSLKKHNLMVINLNWHNQSELPFIIGHEIGHFILGDDKYGEPENPIKRLCLHAYELDLINPITKKEYKLKTKIPEEFEKLMKQNSEQKDAKINKF